MQMPQPLTPARFVHRDNRFRVTVEVDGALAAAHLPNSGRLGELLTPGREIRLASMPGPRRKTLYDLCSLGPRSAGDNAKLLYAFVVLHLVRRKGAGVEAPAGGTKLRLAVGSNDPDS